MKIKAVSCGESTHGLGLTVARSIIEEHNGQLLLQSEPGRGSTFTIKLPRVIAG